MCENDQTMSGRFFVCVFGAGKNRMNWHVLNSPLRGPGVSGG